MEVPPHKHADMNSRRCPVSCLKLSGQISVTTRATVYISRRMAYVLIYSFAVVVMDGNGNNKAGL